ncbi:hypothetical protein DFJ74DRAFT_656203 [Hyaloraphidium curvatum]|nr:hypothetical protein DFJ74DRAFT_656203 [Hyaloraphidium curvatum]
MSDEETSRSESGSRRSSDDPSEDRETKSTSESASASDERLSSEESSAAADYGNAGASIALQSGLGDAFDHGHSSFRDRGPSGVLHASATFPDWTFARFRGEAPAGNRMDGMLESVLDFGKIGSISFGFPAVATSTAGDALATLLSDPEVVLPVSYDHRRRVDYRKDMSAFSDSFGRHTPVNVAAVSVAVELPAVKMTPRQRAVWPRPAIPRTEVSSMIQYYEHNYRGVYIPRDVLEDHVKEALAVDAETRRYDLGLGSLLDIVYGVPFEASDAAGVVLRAEEGDSEEEGDRSDEHGYSDGDSEARLQRAYTPALSHVPDESDWKSWHWAACATGDDFGDIRRWSFMVLSIGCSPSALDVHPFFFAGDSQLETRIVPTPYFRTGRHIRQLLWATFPNQSPRLLYRDRQNINFLTPIVFRPNAVAKLYGQKHASLADRSRRFNDRPPFATPTVATWRFEGDLPVDCDFNRWIPGEVAAVTQRGKVVLQNMGALTEAASLLGSMGSAPGSSWMSQWKCARFSPDHPRIVNVGSARHVGWVDSRAPRSLQHHVLFSAPTSNRVTALHATSGGLAVAATERAIAVFDRRMPQRELTSWTHHFGVGNPAAAITQLSVVEVAGAGRKKDEWIIAASRHSTSTFVVPFGTSTDSCSAYSLADFPFSVPGFRNNVDALADRLPGRPLGSNAKLARDLDERKLLLGTCGRFFPSMDERLVLWQLAEDGSIWCSGLSLGGLNTSWDHPAEHAKTEDAFVAEQEDALAASTAENAEAESWMHARRTVDMRGLLQPALETIASGNVGARDEEEADGEADGFPPEDPSVPHTLLDLLPVRPAEYDEEGRFLRPASKHMVIKRREEYGMPSDGHRLWAPDRPSWIGGIDLSQPYTVWEDLANRYLHPGLQAITDAEEIAAEQGEEADYTLARSLRTESVNRMAGELYLGTNILLPPPDDRAMDLDEDDGVLHSPMLREPLQLNEAAKLLRAQWGRPPKRNYPPIKVDPRTKRAQKAAAAAENDEWGSGEEEEVAPVRRRERSKSVVSAGGSQRAPSQVPDGRGRSVGLDSQRAASLGVGSQRGASVGFGTQDVGRASLPASQALPASQSAKAAKQAPAAAASQISQMLDSYLASQATSTPVGRASQKNPNPNKKPRRSGF